MGNLTELTAAFQLFHEGLTNSEFSKSLYLDHWSERELLPLVRTFLLGYFGHNTQPEYWTNLATSESGWGRVDFLIGNVAVEVAVRRPDKPRYCLLPASNHTERCKLLQHDGKGLLVLLDFSDDPLSFTDLDLYYEQPNLGPGRRHRSPYSILYVSRDRRPVRFTVQP